MRSHTWLLVLTALLAFSLATPEASGQHGGQPGGKFGLELSGSMAGWVKSFEGGASGPNLPAAPADLTLGFGAGMSSSFYGWIKDSLGAKSSPKTGAILAVSYEEKELVRHNFTNALISEIGIPALDATAQSTVTFTAKVSGSDQLVKGSSKPVPGSAPFSQAPPKPLSTKAFKVEIDGIDCSKVAKVDAFTIKMKVNPNVKGGAPSYVASNLVLHLSTLAAPPFAAWQASIAKGAKDGGVKNGKLVFYAPDHQTILFTVSFSQLVLSKLSNENVSAGDAAPNRTRAEMTVGHAQLAAAAAAIVQP